MTTYTDAFTNTNGTLIAAHNASWSDADKLCITSNRLSRVIGSGTVATTRYTGATFSGGDQYVQAKLYGQDTWSYRHRLLLRAGTGNNYCFVMVKGSGCLLYNEPGAQALGTYNGTIAAGDTIRFEVVGTTGTVYHNGTSVIVATLNRTGGYPGLSLEHDSAQFDDFECGDLTAPAGPLPPTSPYADTLTRTGLTARWTDASSDETGFKVEYAPSPYTTWTAAAGSPAAASATSLAITGLDEGMNYKIRVASTNGSGDSVWVESSAVKTLTRLLKIGGIEATAIGATGVDGVVFSAPTGADIIGSKIGEFVDKTLATVSGKAGLNVPIAEFGGTFETSDTPRVYLTDGTNSTGIISATVADEAV